LWILLDKFVCLMTMCEILCVYRHCLRYIFSLISIVRAMRSAIAFSKGRFVKVEIKCLCYVSFNDDNFGILR
jgi:hypothetical protein